VETSQELPNSVLQPLSVYSSRCDDKGRLRLPKEIEDFLRKFPEPEFFVTSLDGNIARIYPIQAWLENEKILAGFKKSPAAARNIAFMAHYWGAVTTIDAQGRVLIPPALRRKLGIEDQKVNVQYYKGTVEVFRESESEQRLASAAVGLAENLEDLEREGLT
jgi:DNA-binding transcriptional regulator/RsmH inhibitor MraZ